jgi:hypothetical protein
MTAANGETLDTVTYQGNNFARLGDQTLQCENSQGHWEDGFFNVDLASDYDHSMGDVTIRVTNTLDQDANDESIGYGDMSLDYDYDPTVEWPERVYPTASPANYDEGHNNPTSLWNNDCSATEKSCGGFNYFGGYNECAQGHRFWRTFYQDVMHPNTNRVTFSGRIWTIDSWDGEHFTVEMTAANGETLDTVTYQGNNFARLGDQTLQCENSQGHWEDGFFNVDLASDYDHSMGDVTIRVTNTLDQDANDESIGYGDMSLDYDYDPTVEWPERVYPTASPANYDEGHNNPTSLWNNDCSATEKSCGGFNYFGGYNECAQGHRFWRTFYQDVMHPNTNRVTFSGRIWTIDSWDGEHFTVEMTAANGETLDTVTYQGNNFARLGDQTLQCENSQGHWEDGFFNVDLASDYDHSMGDVTIRVTNTLDQDANDESIGYGDMSLDYDYDPTVEWPERVYPTASPANYDEGHNNPTSLWNNDCSATEKSCGGFNYFGGYNECAQGHRFWRTFYQDVMHPNTNRVTFSGRIWTIDSWDGEQFTVQMTD